MTLPFKLVSADSHIAEPPDLWTTRIDKKFRDRAPHMVHRDTGDAYIINGASNSASLVGLLATKPKYADPETLFGLEGRWTDVPEGAYDPVARAAELDREGIEAEILYTSVGLGLFGLKDLEFRQACFRAFNDWLAEHCAGAPTSIVRRRDGGHRRHRPQRRRARALRRHGTARGDDQHRAAVGRELRRRQIREVLVGGGGARRADQPPRGGDRNQLDEHEQHATSTSAVCSRPRCTPSPG